MAVRPGRVLLGGILLSTAALFIPWWYAEYDGETHGFRPFDSQCPQRGVCGNDQRDTGVLAVAAIGGLGASWAMDAAGTRGPRRPRLMVVGPALGLLTLIHVAILWPLHTRAEFGFEFWGTTGFLGIPHRSWPGLGWIAFAVGTLAPWPTITLSKWRIRLEPRTPVTPEP